MACRDRKTSDMDPILIGHIYLLCKTYTSSKFFCLLVPMIFQVPLNFTLNQLSVHTFLSLLSSHRIYEVMSWSGSKWASVFFCVIEMEKDPWKSVFSHLCTRNKQETTFGLMKLGKWLIELVKAVENFFHGQLSLCTIFHETFPYVHFCGCEEKSRGSKLSSQIRRFVVEKKKNKTKPTKQTNKKNFCSWLNQTVFQNQFLDVTKINQNQSFRIISELLIDQSNQSESILINQNQSFFLSCSYYFPYLKETYLKLFHHFWKSLSSSSSEIWRAKCLKGNHRWEFYWGTEVTINRRMNKVHLKLIPQRDPEQPSPGLVFQPSASGTGDDRHKISQDSLT